MATAGTSIEADGPLALILDARGSGYSHGCGWYTHRLRPAGDGPPLIVVGETAHGTGDSGP